MDRTFEDAIAQAIGDPGSITDRAEGETVTRWATRAVCELLAVGMGVDPQGLYTGTPATKALMENVRLRSRLAAAQELLAGYVDDEECWIDHHGQCQKHGLSGGDGVQCENVRAKAFLAMFAADLDAAHQAEGLVHFVDDTREWTVTCSQHGEVQRSDGSADGHDDCVRAWQQHSVAEHGGEESDIDAFMWLAPDARPEFRRGHPDLPQWLDELVKANAGGGDPVEGETCFCGGDHPDDEPLDADRCLHCHAIDGLHTARDCEASA